MWRPTQVRVSSLDRAEELSKGWANRIISLVDLGTELLNFHNFHLVVPMSDTDVITDPWAPKLSDIERVFEFALPYLNLVIHCLGGISRSPAMGLGLLIRDGMSVVDACTQIHEQSPNMSPNYLILDHIDTHLKLGGTLSQQVKEVMSTFPKELVLYCAECQLHFNDADGHVCPSKSWQT